ncbi:MAG: hypothetical protein V7K67_01795 [Nostoc sp.]
MKRNPTLPPNFMLGYAIAAPNRQNYLYPNTLRVKGYWHWLLVFQTR